MKLLLLSSDWQNPTGLVEGNHLVGLDQKLIAATKSLLAAPSACSQAVLVLDAAYSNAEDRELLDAAFLETLR